METPPEMAIVWLASYPKSGSTWLRVLLANCEPARTEPVGVNELGQHWTALRRHIFDEVTGLCSAELHPEEIASLRPEVHRFLAASEPSPTFLKTHEQYHPGLGPMDVVAGVVNLVRDPRDVAVSLAHHMAWSVDQTIAFMAASDARLPCAERVYPELPERIGSWFSHGASWNSSPMPRLRLTYEELSHDTHRNLGRVLDFCGLRCTAERIDRAVRWSRFEALQAQEAVSGFRERQPTSQSFFREGKVGGWQGRLTPRQVETILRATLHTDPPPVS
jgi:hypothetical protein